MFVSTFYSTEWALGASWSMPSLDIFIVDLKREKEKLIQMVSLNSTKPQALLRGNESHPTSECEKKNTKKDKKVKKEGNIDNSKKSSQDKKRFKCSFFKNLGHDEDQCMKKQIGILPKILKNNSIRL